MMKAVTSFPRTHSQVPHAYNIRFTRNVLHVPVAPAKFGFTSKHVSPTRDDNNKSVRCSAAGQTGGKYAELLQGKQEAQDLVQWFSATVVENKEASADGSARSLLLSIEDPGNLVDGRKVKHIQERVRWLDSYQVPGQFVAVRMNAMGGSLEEECTTLAVARRLFAIASSPYAARVRSEMLDASLVEIIASREGEPDEAALANLGPGALIEVSEVLGRGYCSLFNSAVGLQSALEEGRSLLMVASGCQGIASLKAALDWTPVQAHATTHNVTLLYVTKSPTKACFLVDWDSWRDAGVRVHVLYSDDIGNNGAASSQLQEMLEGEIFHREHGIHGTLGGDPREAAVMMAGLPGDVAGHLTKKLTQAGVHEWCLFADFF